jgi:hypothetical protein
MSHRFTSRSLKGEIEIMVAVPTVNDETETVQVPAGQLQELMDQLKSLRAQVNAQAQVGAKPAKEKPTDPNVIGCATIREPNEQFGASIKFQPSFTTFPHAGVQKAVKFWRDVLDHVDDLKAAVARAERLYPDAPKADDDKPRTNGRRTKAGTAQHPSTQHGGTIVI